MPLGDIASGCLELVVRVILEVVVNGLGEILWRWCQISGAFVTWLITFGRVSLEDRRDRGRDTLDHENAGGDAVKLESLSLWLDSTPRSGPLNMALDEAMLLRA